MGDGWTGDGQTSNTIFGLALSAVRSLKRKPLSILLTGIRSLRGRPKNLKREEPIPTKFQWKVYFNYFGIQRKVFPTSRFHSAWQSRSVWHYGPLSNFRTFIVPTRFGFNLPQIKTTIIGLNNVQLLGLDKNNQPIYRFPPLEKETN